MRQRNWIPAVLVVALLLPARDANAFWEYIRELSGPGPFLGADFRYSFPLVGSLTVTRELNNENLATLRMLGVDAEFLAPTVDEFVATPGHQRLLNKEFEVSLPDPQDCLPEKDLPKIAVCRFLKGTEINATHPRRKLQEHLEDRPHELTKFTSQPTVGGERQSAEERWLALEGLLERVQTRELRKRIRNYDVGWRGLLFFGGFRPIPDLKDHCGTNRINNWFLTLSLGVAYAVDNKIPYADGFDGNKQGFWLSLYPAFEKRFRPLAGGDLNWFVQFGPAVHYFTVDQFEDLWKGSARVRVGLQIGRPYVGVQTDFFFKPIRNEEFGALPDGDGTRWSFGIVFGISLNK